MPTTITFCKLNFRKLYAKSRKLGIAEWNDSLDYADFIHGLWHTMCTHEDLIRESSKIEEILNEGDAIELLSEIVMEHRRLQSL
jgi:hypothetical protein